MKYAFDSLNFEKNKIQSFKKALYQVFYKFNQ